MFYRTTWVFDLLNCLLSEPFDPPQNVTIVNADASSVTLMWYPPTEPNGIIVHYTIYYSFNNIMNKKVRQKYWRQINWVNKLDERCWM